MSESANFQQIDLRSASEHEYQCLAAFSNILYHEYFPDDPLLTLEEQIQDLKNIPALIEFQAFVGWNSTHTQAVALAAIFIRHTGDNEHAAQFRIEIHPEYRCQGFGRETLKLLLPFAKEHHR